MILKISLNHGPDAGHKKRRFSKTFAKKDLVFALIKRSDILVLDLSFMLLSTKIYCIVEEQNHKKHTFRACDIGHVKIIFILLTKIVALYI